jgi:RNA polymerase sigma factor (sigma-70 family)
VVTADEEDRWFKQEVQPHEQALRRFLHHKYPHFSDIDDVVQDSFLVVLLHWKNGTLASARGLLFRAAHNRAIDFFRKRKPVSDIPVSELPPWRVIQENVNVAEQACSGDQLAFVMAAVDKLPRRCREVMLLRLTLGSGYAEIAEQLGISEKTVRAQMVRGIARCLHHLRSSGILEEEGR